MNAIKQPKKIFFFTFQFFLILLISMLYYFTLPFKSESVIYIPQGSINKIISNLNNNGYEMSEIDKYILYFLGKPQSGWINIGENSLVRMDFLYKVTTAKAALQDITLIPGETTLYFFRDLAKKLDLNEDKIWNEYKKKTEFDEGVLYPETYKIPKGITEELLVKLLVDYSKNAYAQIAKKYLGLENINDKTWRDIIIAASVIQKEAANKNEMQVVASVIYNRIRKGMKLQMDGTLNYGLYSHTKITPERIRNDESFYNTYKFAGFPKDAVCNVSEDAIKAVIAEKKFIAQNQKGSTNFLYFMRDKKTGLHIFTTNIEDHNKAVDAQR